MPACSREARIVAAFAHAHDRGRPRLRVTLSFTDGDARHATDSDLLSAALPAVRHATSSQSSLDVELVARDSRRARSEKGGFARLAVCAIAD